MKIRAKIIEKQSLEQMYNIRYDFHNGHKAGKMRWDWIEVETVLDNLNNDNVMVFTQKFGEVDITDIDKINSLLK
jgi:hypothetical protein